MAGVDRDIIGQMLQEVFADRDNLKRLLEYLLNAAMKAELADHIKADKYERGPSRLGHRNGYKSRTLSSRVGRLELDIPQARNCDPYQPSMFARFQRSERALLVACGEMYFQGVSTRKVQEVLEMMCGMDISSSTVSRVAAEIDEKLAVFAARKLDKIDYPYLHIDARYEKIRVDGHVVSQAVLVAAGFTSDGRREILDWRIADSESEGTWGELFKSLKDRGLGGLKMIVSDAHSGIRAAMARHFQGVEWQRCRVHFKRELFRKVPWKHYRQIADEIASVYKPQEKNECSLRGREMAQRWQNRYPSLAKMIEEGLEDTLAVCDMPPDLRRKMNSTNLLENIMKRLKARTRVVQVFPDRASCYRLIGAQLLELHEDWLAEERPYLPAMNRPRPWLNDGVPMI